MTSLALFDSPEKACNGGAFYLLNWHLNLSALVENYNRILFM